MDLKFFKDYLPQISLGPFLNTITQMKIMLFYSKILVKRPLLIYLIDDGSYTSKLKIFDVSSSY